ncbi:MAG: trypsin-like peptidase domain-containing protein [Bryobacteraceae bacterium]
MASTLETFSNDLAAAVEAAGQSLLAVNGRPKTPSSGIHWRAGIVVTTNHTLQQDDDITVTTSKGDTLPATVAGRDPGTDIAVLKVPGLEIPVSELAETASVKVGHIVLALGRGITASLGTISSKSGAWRTWRGGSIDSFIRPDVNIYTGFSGGALIDAAGKVIGMNTSGLSRGGGLTLPASTVSRVCDELSKRGRIARGYLGIGMQPVRLSPTSSGLIVLSVEQDGPAHKAGLLVGDILIAIGNTPLHDTGDLQTALAAELIDKPVVLNIVRGGKPAEVTVTVGERP